MYLFFFFPPRIFFIKKKGTKPKHILQSISPQQQGKDRPNLIGPTAQPNQATPRRAGRLSFGPRVKERGHVLEFHVNNVSKTETLNFQIYIPIHFLFHSV